MDKDILLSKLESLGRCVARVREKTPATPALLRADLDAQDIVAVNLERAVQLCVDIGAHLLADSSIAAPSTMGEIFERLAELNWLPQVLAANLKRAVGFRNIAVHAYRDIDWAVVHAIATARLDDFTAFTRHVLKRIGPG